MTFYNTIAVDGMAEYKDRGSKFIAYALPFVNMKDLKAKINHLKAEHTKAVHFCFAYRIGIDGLAFRSSDDGEPAGTAGKPILGQIDSRSLTNILVVVVRYFGGTLLGVPGLINAYKSVTSLVLQVVPIIQKPILISYTIQLNYTQMNEVLTIVRQFNCEIIQQEHQLFSKLIIGIPPLRLDDVIHRVKNLLNVEIAVLV